MLKTQPPPPKQVLLRLPDDVASKLARAVPSRRRNQFLVDLVRRELDKEDQALVAACEAMNALEAANPALLQETHQWMEADLVGAVDDWDEGFDAETFSREAAFAQAALSAPALARGGKA
jgi:hypothetical protein